MKRSRPHLKNEEKSLIDKVQNGETHGHMKLIESTPSCRKIFSSKVWISFSLIFLLNMYLYEELCSHGPLEVVRGPRPLSITSASNVGEFQYHAALISGKLLNTS
jgi:hypothetical protein